MNNKSKRKLRLNAKQLVKSQLQNSMLIKVKGGLKAERVQGG